MSKCELNLSEANFANAATASANKTLSADLLQLRERAPHYVRCWLMLIPSVYGKEGQNLQVAE